MGHRSQSCTSQSPGRRYSVSLLAPLIERPAFARWIIGAAVVHLALVHTLHLGLSCAIHDLTGIPCPGCGLTAATLQLLAGHWRTSLTLHPFAPVFLLALGVLFLGTILPSERSRHFAAWVACHEKRHRLTFWLAAGLLTCWLSRVIFP